MKLPPFLLLLAPALAATSDQWRARSIYQVLTDRFARTDGRVDAPCDAGQRRYCGGTFRGVQSHLDYIQGMGFDAVWISPVTGQVEGETAYGEAYHGYWQQDIFSINGHFGTGDELRALADALHERDMYLMVDVVVNHFAWPGAPSDVDYTTFHPFNTSSAYHPYCPINFDDTANTTQLEQCWMGDTSVSLPDLRTEDAAIASQWSAWIADLIATYAIDGLRLDSAIEVNPSFWQPFGEAAGVYFVGETYNPDPSFVCPYQSPTRLPGVMDYPTYFPLLAALATTPPTDPTAMAALASTLDAVKTSCPDTSLKGTFTENHDRPRLAHLNPDVSAARNALVYTLLADGLPIVYQGQEQHYASLGGADDPYNREALWLSGYNTSAPLYALVGQLNVARKMAIAHDPGYLTYRSWPIYSDTTTIALRKGSMITVLSNKGSAGDAYTQVVPAGYEPGMRVREVLTCGAVVVADAEGGIRVPMVKGEPRVYYPDDVVVGAEVCAAGEGGDGSAAAAAEESGEEKAENRPRRRAAKWHALTRHPRGHHP